MSGITDETLPEALAAASGATELALEQSGLTETGVCLIAAALSEGKLAALEALRLGGNRADDRGAVQLAGALEHGRLRLLGLESNGIGDWGGSSLGEKLVGEGWLEELRLGGNRLETWGADGLATGLAGNARLQTLDLNSNKINSDGVPRLAEGLAKNTTLRRLRLSGNCISVRGLGRLAAGLHPHSGLEQLGLNECAIGPGPEIAEFAAAVQLTRINSLSMARNPFGSAGLAELARCGGLTNLDVSGCRIDGDGLGAVLAAFERPSRLQKLLMQSNPIGDDGAVALARWVGGEDEADKIPLECLGLDDCGIGELGGQAVQAMVASSPQLTQLTVEGNPMPDPCLEAIRGAVITNKYW